MTLIPLISALAGGRRAAPEPAGAAALARHGYDSGAGHRPVAAMLAIGLPAALVAAVALSPMIIEDKPTTETPPWTTIWLPESKPPEPKEAKPQPQQPTETVITATKSPLPPQTPDAPTGTIDPPYVPPAGTGTGPAVIVEPAPPPAPPLILAKLDPKYAGVFQPDYPVREQRAEIEGVVRVRVLIGTDGHVKAVELVSGDNPSFFEATKRRALSKWRFKPATRGGIAEESWKEMTVRFEIRKV